MRVPVPMIRSGGGGVAVAIGFVLLLGVALYAAKTAPTGAAQKR
jgi:hypothetical protein